MTVSIHAPTGGATSPSSLHSASLVFQSTRPRGARLHLFRILLKILRGFNPRAHGGRDLRLLGLCLAAGEVSIHAPTGGATARSAPSWRSGCSFNPRAHGGRDQILLLRDTITAGFNPRAHGGRDRGTQARAGGDDRVSIHAPTGGATVALYGSIKEWEFQSTRPRGARRRPRRPHRLYEQVSIHAPTGGAT